MHITFRSNVTRSGKSGSGHLKPIIIGSSGGATTIEPVGMFRHVRKISFLHAPPVDKKDITSVMRDTRGWKSKWLPLSSLLSWQIYYRPTHSCFAIREETFSNLSGDRQVLCVHGFHKGIFGIVIKNIWTKGRPVERSCLCSMPFSFESPQVRLSYLC